jgi:hypothetical protein
MPWRLHLANQALARLDILQTDTRHILAAWTQPGRVFYFDLKTGASLGEGRFQDLANREYDHWQTLLPDMQRDQQILPVIPAPDATIYLNQTGQLRLHHLHNGSLYLALGPREKKFDGEFAAVSLGRTSGSIAALDTTGKLRMYRQDALVSHYQVEDFDNQLFAAVASSDSRVYLAHGYTLLQLDAQGKVQQTRELPYPVGAFACSAQGRWLACGDRENNVIRVYDATSLMPGYQRHAIDLLAKTRRVQLLADPPPAFVALNHLAIDDTGSLAFALAGVICVSALDMMATVPGIPQP